MNAIDTFDFECNDMNFRASMFADEVLEEPWKVYDCHGEVSEWTTRAKAPGEMVLCNDRSLNRYYDFQGAVQKALKECWGYKNSDGLTKRQIATKAAIENFNYLRKWCNGDWFWIGITVDLLDDDGDLIEGYTQFLGGIESDAHEYHKEIAAHLADEIIASIQHYLAA